MHYRLNLIVPTLNLTIQEGRFAEWAASPSDPLLESRKWLALVNGKWIGLPSQKGASDQSDQTSFPGAPGIAPCVANDDVSVAVGVPFSMAGAGAPGVSITVVFARNQLGQSISASPFETTLATLDGSPLKCTFAGSPVPLKDDVRSMYWYNLKLTDVQVALKNRIGRYEFNVGALLTTGLGLSEYAHDPEMDVGS